MKKRLTPEEFVKMARQMPPDERVPYAFEKRVMAHLSPALAPDSLSLWTHALWRAVAPCLGIMLIAAAVSFSQPDEATAESDIDLESAVMAPPESAFDLSA